MLLDTGDDPRGEFELMRKAVAHFIKRVGQRPMALGTFGARPVMLTTFDDERQTVMEKLDAVTAESGAAAAAAGRGAGGRDVKGSTGALFSAIVIVSATADDASRGHDGGVERRRSSTAARPCT